MSELSKSDTELAFKYLPENVRSDVEYDAYDATMTAWREDRPDDLDRLEAAHEVDGSGFSWDIDLTFEQHQIDGRDELVPHTYTGDAAEDVHELARDFGWDYVDAVREEIRALQESTNFSPREFVAFVLSESRLTYDAAAREMGVSSGTFASKMSREIQPEIEAAEQTLTFVEKFDD